jgi:hypothetical protein
MNHFWRLSRTTRGKVLNTSLPNGPFHVISFGGSGSKILADALFLAMSEAPRPEVAQLHSHRRLPPASIPTGQHIVYVFADPRNAVLSFFDRRTANHNFAGFGARSIDKPAPQWVLQHMENLRLRRDR